MKKIVLHVGMHKTGSTSIQAALDGYRDEVYEYAPLPPVIEEERGNAFNHSLLMSAAFDRNYKEIGLLQRRGLDDGDIEALRWQCRSELSTCLERSEADVVILSAESVTNFDAESTRALGDFLHRYASDVQVCAYVRDPFGYVKSVTQEVIKAGYTDDRLFPMSYRKDFVAAEEVFGADHVSYRVYRRDELVDGDVVADFWSWIGLRKDPPNNTEVNVALSTDATRCIYALNGSAMASTGNSLLFASRQELQNVLVRLFPGRFNLPDHLVAKEIDVWDLAWMEARLEQRLEIPPYSEEHLDVSGLKDWLGRVPARTVERIRRELVERGAPVASNAGLTELVDQLYMECIRSVSGEQFDYRRFSTRRYLEKYADVGSSGLHPFGHYVLYGHGEGRDDL